MPRMPSWMCSAASQATCSASSGLSWRLTEAISPTWMPCFSAASLAAGGNPHHHVVEGEALGAAEGDGREAQFEVADVIQGGILHRFARDAVNHIGRTVEEPQGVELGEEILEGERVAILHLHQFAEAGGDGDVMRPGDLQHRVNAQGPLQVAVEIHLGEGTVNVGGGAGGVHI